MKKLAKTLALCAVAATLSVGAVAFAGCDNGENDKKESTGASYAMVHTAGKYIGYSTVTLKGDEIKDVTLTEVCLPDRVTYTVGEGNDAVKTKYAKVTYGNVTMLWDAEASAYKVGDKVVKEYFASEENCRLYYEAAIGNKISAYETVDGEAKTNVMTKATLSKEENGYWNEAKGSKLEAVDGSWWKANRDATVKYVKEHGVANLLKLERNSDNYWMDGDVSTGATWSDMSSANGATSTGATTYAQLITDAYNYAKGVVVEGEYHYENIYNKEAPHYGIKVRVTVKDNKILKVERVASDYVEVSAAGGKWTAENIANWHNNLSDLLAKYEGKTVDAVKALTGTIQGIDKAEKNELSDSNLVITGATQGCVRVLKAVQNALGNL